MAEEYEQKPKIMTQDSSCANMQWISCQNAG